MLRHHSRLLPLAALIVACASAIVLAKIKVQVDFDQAFDFGTLRTWTWHPDGPGNARMLMTKDDDSAAFKKQFEPRLLPLVEAELAGRGFAKAASGEPDFHMTYYTLVTAGASDQYMGQFLPGTVWGVPFVPPATSSLSVFPQGALILDVTSRAQKMVVWRGVAQAEIKWDESQSKRDARVREAVQELLKQFPPKPKKK
jgi:hypothetical protein